MRTIASTGRDNTFDFLRLFAAVVVVIAHAQHELGTQILWNASQLFDGIGMFFIMSGYLIWQSAVSTRQRTGGWVVYFQNRALRILPALYVFALLMPVLLAAMGAMPWRSLISEDMLIWLGSAAFILPAYDPAIWEHVGTGNLNGHLYTIPAEVSFYVAVPLLVWVAKKWGIGWIVGLVGLAAIVGPLVMFFFSGPIATFVHFTFIERAAYFLVGVLAAVFKDRIRLNPWAFVAALGAYFSLKVFGTGQAWFRIVQPLWLAVPLGYAVLYFGHAGPRALRKFTSWFGDLSYGTYIWHVVVIELFVWAGWIGQWWLVLGVLAVSLAAAQVSWRLVEKPSLALKRLTSRNRERPSERVVPVAM